MHLCENLGTRAPSVTTPEDWMILQTFVREKIYNRGLNKVKFWLPISDAETEDVWKDYNGTTIQNYTLPWSGGKPDGGVSQNCARLFDEKSWADQRCDYPHFSCMCVNKPDFYLKLRGLCPNSAIDVFYKPMNDRADFRKLKIQGLQRSSISFDEAKKIWSLKVAQSNMSATSKGSHASHTLGKHNWTSK